MREKMLSRRCKLRTLYLKILNIGWLFKFNAIKVLNIQNCSNIRSVIKIFSFDDLNSKIWDRGFTISLRGSPP